REGLDPAALGGDDRGHHRLLVDVQPADVLANNLQLTLPPSRLGRTWGGRFSCEESLQRAPASGRGNNSRSLSVRQPMLPHELVASVSARATAAPDHQEANLGPTGTSPTRVTADAAGAAQPGIFTPSRCPEGHSAPPRSRGSTRRSRGRGAPRSRGSTR